jgi:hypothetical protein
VQFKLAILIVLARRSGGRASLDDLKEEVEALTAGDDQSEGAASALDEIDIFQSGLIVPDGDGLLITDAGRSALRALEASNEPSLDFPASSPSPSLKMIDQLIGTEERLTIFDLELRGADVVSPERSEDVRDAQAAYSENISSVGPVALDDQEPYDDLPRESIAHPAPAIGDADVRSGEPIEIARRESDRSDAPAFLAHGFESAGRPVTRAQPRQYSFGSAIAAVFRQVRTIWQRHLERDASNPRVARKTGKFGGGAIAILTLLVLVICAGAVIAFTQIKSLKSEIATLQRELSPLRERAARADLLEKAKQDADQQRELRSKSGAEANSGGPPPRTEQAALNLTPEEIRLIRDFIKPAPAAAKPGPAINVGDTVGIATIPLPSPLMEKIPKLLGARFTTRNGSIIILRRDSRQADLVLPPN